MRMLTQVMLTIGLSDLTRRVELKGPQDELYALAQAFNQMLNRLEEGFEKQKGFLAAVSHDLLKGAFLRWFYR
ncbi:HAMP domain-containing protein [Thermodesulfitimonas sp.]